jgi:hypothetical protein
MILIASKYLIPKGYTAMAIFPFVLLRDKKLQENAVLINHEKIHLRQQAELLILPFYIWYVAEYLLRLIAYRDRNKAYRNISFEREAYTNESNSNYLKNRPLWNFIKFTHSNS